MKRTPLRPGRGPRRRSWPKRRRKPLPRRNEERAAEQFARRYGSRERGEWMAAWPCDTCGAKPWEAKIDNSHVAGRGPEGIIPQCHLECHLGIYHGQGRETAARKAREHWALTPERGDSFEARAAWYEREWKRHLEGSRR